jgi:hypothetical protein
MEVASFPDLRIGVTTKSIQCSALSPEEKIGAAVEAAPRKKMTVNRKSRQRSRIREYK